MFKVEKHVVIVKINTFEQFYDIDIRDTEAAYSAN